MMRILTMQLSANNLEKVLQKSLPYFFALVFITTMVGALSGYLEHRAFRIGDWLINYQGGMIRRGFSGEVFYQLAHFTHINPGLYVFIFQIFFYAVFLFFAYALLKKQQVLLPYALLIFSPFIFTFQINAPLGGFRKEIIYFALLAFVTWSASAKEYKTFEKIFYITLLFYPAVILTHEMLAIFLPYLLVVYLSVTTLTNKKLLIITLLLFPSIASFIAAIYYPGTFTQVAEITNSIARENYSIIGGGFDWIGKDTSYGIAQVIEQLKDHHYAYYIFVAPLALLAYIPIYGKLKLIIKNKLSLLLILISVIGSVGLFIVAIDWGRFIYIHLVSIFLLSLISTKKIESYNEYTYKQPVNIFMVAFFMIYSLLWHIPHCCYPVRAFAKNYKQTNIVAFAKPYKRIFLFFSKR